VATLGAKQAIVQEQDLPPFTVFKDGSFGYVVRYRLVSEDGNRFSHYSPIETVKPNYVFERPANKAIDDFVIVRQGPYINVVWDAVSIKDRISKSLIRKSNQYDLWISWTKGESNGVFIPADRVDGNLQGFIIPLSYLLATGSEVAEEPTRLSVEVYLRATEQSRSNTALLVYKLDNADITVPASPPPN
jgi:hypothetical protein